MAKIKNKKAFLAWGIINTDERRPILNDHIFPTADIAEKNKKYFGDKVVRVVVLLKYDFDRL